jgi:hypothetical protein
MCGMRFTSSSWGCDWYKIYDICEALREDLSIYSRAVEFTHQLNELFEEEEGI